MHEICLHAELHCYSQREMTEPWALSHCVIFTSAPPQWGKTPLNHYHLNKIFVNFDSDRQYKHEIVENKALEKVRFWIVTVIE